MWIKTHRHFVRMKDALLIDAKGFYMGRYHGYPKSLKQEHKIVKFSFMSTVSTGQIHILLVVIAYKHRLYYVLYG